MSYYRTSSSNHGFHTPKTFQPDQGNTRRSGPSPLPPRTPTPSKWEDFMEELGLTQDDVGKQYGGLSDSDNSGDERTNDYSTTSSADLEVLQKELEEKDRQREDLLLKVKTYRENARKYRSRCEKEQRSKAQQIKIMRKTHESHLEEKRQLIRNLQDIIEEQETRIFELEGELKGPVSPSKQSPSLSSNIQKLTASLDRLQAEMAGLQEKQMTAEGELESRKEDDEREKKDLMEEVNELKEELEEAHKMIRKLQSGEILAGSTDNEKEIENLKSQISRLQEEQLRKAQAHDEKVAKEDRDKLKKIQSENTNLKDRILEMEADLATKSKILSESETNHKTSQAQLEGEISEQAARLKEIEEAFSQLKDNPQVVEVTKTVSVESKETLKNLAAAQGTNIKLKTQLATLKKLCADHEEKSKIKMIEMKEIQKKMTDQEHIMDIMKTEMDDKVMELEQSKLEAIEETRQAAEQETQELKTRYHNIRSKFSTLKPGILHIGNEYKQLRSLCAQFPTLLKNAIQQTKDEIGEALAGVTEHNRELTERYHREMTLRKKYHNELIDLKGNIRVFCRVRPIIKEDGTGILAKSVISFDTADDGILFVNNNKGRTTMYEADRVFTADSTQEQVFKEVEPIIISSIDGYNVCIFAYGQTGSGKTFTMEGSVKNPGINQRALQLLFEETKHRSAEWSFVITVAVMEIYNEQIRDLLSDDPSYKLDVKMNPEGGYHVPGLNEIIVTSVDDVNEVFKMGKSNRATACTDMNEHSSRSHALLCVKIIGTNRQSKKRTNGKLNLVDLAGSERVGKSGTNMDNTRLKEAQSINKSLSCLGDVIHALRAKQNHIPYRNSKLTYLLQESLGGDSKTLMMVQVSPVAKNVGESQCSLSFAQRVRAVELGAASKKTETAEVAALKERLAQYEDSPSSASYSSPSQNKSTPKRNGYARSTPNSRKL
ncbi:kinesin-like protein KIFC3 [Amphiura filiformis]|uniref:kinesin-like protein KIFC3 n=1 Tax=Amphiura filiformis TaxID=82378 RepID=UPI003B20F69F